jgi:hypothetical protein
MHTNGQSNRTTSSSIDPKARFYNEHHVAERLGISVNTLRRWRLLGKGPVFRKFAGASVRYGESDIELFVANSPTGGTTEAK